MTVKIEIWDLPLRLFHWLLVLSVLSAVITGELGGNLIDGHGRIGVLIMGLLVFRIVWGFVGTAHARFANFFPTPTRIGAYLKGQWQGHGHNPLGALSVMALLCVSAILVVTGLFANDDIAFQGPLFNLITKQLSDKLSGLHKLAFNLLALLVALHIVAIIFYAGVRKNNLVLPMMTGKKVVPKDHAVPVSSVRIGRLLAALTVSGVAMWGIVSGVQYFIPAQAAPAAAAPGW
jgi:cytochrome b